MIRRLVTTLVVAVLALVTRGPTVAAQSATDLLTTGMRSYQNLDYEAAAATLRKGLLRATSDTFSTPERLQALTYLGATELFRRRRDSAVAAFRQIAVTDPTYRPSAIIFPPQVTSLFQEVRQGTRTVFIRVPPETEFRARAERLTARLVASTPHDIAVAVTRDDGAVVNSLYSGPIDDSLAVTWDGTERGEAVKSGHYLLRVTSQAAASARQLVRQLPLEIERARPDTQAWPSLADATSPGVRSGPAVRSLAGGLAAAVAVVVLPSIVAHDADGIKGRFAVAAAIGGAGLASFFAQRSAPPLDVVAGANAAARDAAKRRLEDVRRQNAKALAEIRLRVRAGPATLLEQGAQ